MAGRIGDMGCLKKVAVKNCLQYRLEEHVTLRRVMKSYSTLFATRPSTASKAETEVFSGGTAPKMYVPDQNLHTRGTYLGCPLAQEMTPITQNCAIWATCSIQALSKLPPKFGGNWMESENFSYAVTHPMTSVVSKWSKIWNVCTMYFNDFYRAMLCICGTSHGPVSVCLSQVGVLLKRLNRGSHKQHHTIAQEI